MWIFVHILSSKNMMGFYYGREADDFDNIASALITTTPELPKKEVASLIDSTYMSYTAYLKSKEPPQEPYVIDADDIHEMYEQYKLSWLSEHGYTLLDFLLAVTSYAEKHGRIKDLTEDPLGVMEDWEDEEGFGNEIYDSLDCFADAFIEGEGL